MPTSQARHLAWRWFDEANVNTNACMNTNTRQEDVCRHTHLYTIKRLVWRDTFPWRFNVKVKQRWKYFLYYGYMRAILSMEKTNFVFRFTSNLLISTQQIWTCGWEGTIFWLLRARNVFRALVLSQIHTLLTLTGSEHQSGGCVSHRWAQNTRDVPLCYEWKIVCRHRGALPWHAAKGMMDATSAFSKPTVEMLKLLLLFCWV